MGIRATLWGVLLLLVVGAVGYGVYWVDVRLDTLATLNAAGRTLERLARQENGDLRLERRRLSDQLTQAQTTTSWHEASLSEALSRLQLETGLRRELAAQLRLKTAERLGETVGRIAVRDTVTVPIAGDIPRIQTDWLDASLIGGVFAYEFRGEFHYIHISHVERSGAVRIIESAYLQSVRNPLTRRFVPVTSAFTVRKPTTRALVWDPTAHLGVAIPTPIPALAFSLISYGTTRQGQDVLFSGPVAGLTLDRRPALILSPMTVNVGRWLPVLDDVFVTGGAAWTPGVWGLRLLVSTSL